MSNHESLILEGSIQPDRTKTYLMLPFDMPSDVIRIDVAYEYSAAIDGHPRVTGGNTVDIGIFDPRGDKGFRGWSGSARSEFFITPTDSTPGYIAGPLQEGTWYVCLGLYKIADDGCEFRVSITLTYGEQSNQTGFQKQLELSKQAHPTTQVSGWYKGDLHCHTQHSDGDSMPLDVVRHAESLGLDFLAITDHNVLSHRIPLRDVETSLMLIPGTEVTTYRGHWNTWGDGTWIDFRITSEEEMQQAVNTALEQGYLISCNHPRPYGPEWGYPNIVGFNCIEVWNGPWELMNDVALAYWETKLKAGEHYVAVGGSDNHFLKREHHAHLGTPTTHIYCEGEVSPVALLAGLRSGHAFISESPDGAEVYISVGDAIMGDTVTTSDSSVSVQVSVRKAMGKQVQLYNANGVLMQFDISDDDWHKTMDVDIQQALYLRAQVVSETDAKQHVHALTNPIYIRQL